MALNRRSGQRFQASIWPGFVDAMTGLLLVLMFVLTIFMVVQSVLRETITGQESELSDLSSQISSLADALGLERNLSNALENQVDSLNATLSQAADEADAQSALITALSAERDARTADLAAAQVRITGFEARVAALLTERDTARSEVADLEGQRAELLSEQDTLNLALASARGEIDAQSEAARLAAARREALDAMVADLRAQQVETTETLEAAQVQISDLEAQQFVDAAAAQTLRDRLQSADAELTAMTLALEEQRKDAEDTLTLLAAANAARDDIGVQLAAALLARNQTAGDLQSAQEALEAAIAASADRSEIEARLATALLANQDAQAQLNAAQNAQTAADQTVETLQANLENVQTNLTQTQSALGALQLERASLAEQLAQAIETNATLEAALIAARAEADQAGAGAADLQAQLAATITQRNQAQAAVEAARAAAARAGQGASALQDQLAAALAARLAAEQDLETRLSEQEERDALLNAANNALRNEEALSAESQRQVQALNEQVAELRTQVGTLQSLLNIAAQDDLVSDVQIQALGSQLNTALARVASEERRRAELEEAARKRLQAEAQNLERYRSEFFGELRDLLGGQAGVRIEGDRFVFASEVLFAPGSATLSGAGQAEIAKVAGILRQVADDIPSEINWVIRVDGHTDNVPLSGTGEFANNWELSQSRALSVVLYMVDFLAIPPQRLAANGFGQYQPVNPDDTPEARAQNRRIELKFTER
jgi:chemotaxis protein MotB